jgi:lysophospholipase
VADVETISESGTDVAPDGTTLWWVAMAPVEPRGLVVLLHGYGEHSGRYTHVVDALVEGGFAVLRFDMRGHGRSSGRRGYVRAYDEYLADLERMLTIARRSAPGRPLFLVAHSHGGLVALRRLVDRDDDIAGAVLSAPYVAAHRPPPRPVVAFGRAAGRVIPWLPMPFGRRPEQFTSDAGMQAEAAADPLRTPIATPRWYGEMRRAQELVAIRAAALRLPVLVLLAGDDTVTSSVAVRRAFEETESDDATVITYPDQRHELFNEQGRDEVLADVVDWLRRRI